MATSRARWILAGTLAAVLLVALLLRMRAEPPDPRDVLRDSISVLRASADSCRTFLDEDAAALHAYNSRVDSMRERVRELEAYDPRGVPADSYDIYLDEFNRYNDSAAAFPELADSVRAADARCRTVAERHNVLVDSLTRLLIPSIR